MISKQLRFRYDIGGNTTLDPFENHNPKAKKSQNCI
jgi:hypothetical protein